MFEKIWNYGGFLNGKNFIYLDFCRSLIRGQRSVKLNSGYKVGY